MESINDYLHFAVERNGSDLHLKAGGPAFLRVDGDLKPISKLPPLSPKDTEAFAREIMDARTAKQFLESGEADFALSVSGLGRFRVNAFRQRGSIGMVLRRVLSSTPEFDSLGLPPAVRALAEEHRGLVLVTGPTGSGKTTTTAAMLGHINKTRRCHVVTIEDPIEVLHRDEMAIIDQREIGVDTADFQVAMKAVSRQDPDVIFIGEMRDLETVTAVVTGQLAEGHRVPAARAARDRVGTCGRRRGDGRHGTDQELPRRPRGAAPARGRDRRG